MFFISFDSSYYRQLFDPANFYMPKYGNVSLVSFDWWTLIPMTYSNQSNFQFTDLTVTTDPFKCPGQLRREDGIAINNLQYSIIKVFHCTFFLIQVSNEMLLSNAFKYISSAEKFQGLMFHNLLWYNNKKAMRWVTAIYTYHTWNTC